jgi:hypothetical protein
VAGLAVLGWQWRHPRAFDEPGGFGMSGHRHAVGDSVYVGLVFEKEDAEGSASIDDVRPRVTRNTASAEIRSLLCTIADDADVGAIGLEGPERIAGDCGRLVPVEGTTMQLNASPRQEIVFEVTLTEPGAVEIKGADVTYSYGWQHGTQRTGGDLLLATSKRESQS